RELSWNTSRILNRRTPRISVLRCIDEWVCWMAFGWSDPAHHNLEHVPWRSQTISWISRMKQKSFVHVIVWENCCCTKEAIDFWKFPAENLVRSKSAQRETRVSFGCNRCFRALIP